MSDHDSSPSGADGDGVQCESCGATFDDDHGLSVHEGRWCTGSADGVVTPSEIGVSELEDVIFSKTEDELKATLEVLDFEGKDEDSLQTKTAKAVLTEKDVGSDGYIGAFGECPECSWGVNGFEADYCVKHQPSADEEDSSEDEGTSTESGSESTENTSTDKSVEVDGIETAKKIAQLREEVGLDWDEAAKAVEVLFG